jgi:hypothetical protein
VLSGTVSLYDGRSWVEAAGGGPMTGEERAAFMIRHDTYWV